MSEAIRKTDEEIAALMAGFAMLEASFAVVPPGDGTVPLIEQYDSVHKVPPELQAAYQAQQASFRDGGCPAFLADVSLASMEDTQQLSVEDRVRVDTTRAGAQVTPPVVPGPADTSFDLAAAFAPPDSTTTRLKIPVAGAASSDAHPVSSPHHLTSSRPRHVRPEPLATRLFHAGKDVSRNIIRFHKRGVALAAMLGVAVAAYTLWPESTAAEVPVIVTSAATPESSAEAKRTVLLNAETLRQTGTCAPEAIVMADYISRQEALGVDMSATYPTAAEYRAAARRAAENKVPCTGEGADPAVFVNETRVGADALLGYMFDVRRMCTVTARVDARHAIASAAPGDWAAQTAHLSDLVEAAGKAC